MIIKLNKKYRFKRYIIKFLNLINSFFLLNTPSEDPSNNLSSPERSPQFI